MTREQTQDFLAMIQGVYPNFNPPNKTIAVNAWKIALEDYEEKLVHAAFKMYIQSDMSGFAPAPGQIIKNIHELTEPQELNEIEAWSLVQKALYNSGYHYVEEFAKLPPLVQKAVGTPNQLRIWATTENLNKEVVMSNFAKVYNEIVKKHQKLNKLPKTMREKIEEINKFSDCAKIEKERQEAIIKQIEHEAQNHRAIEVEKIIASAPEKYYELMERLKNNK